MMSQKAQVDASAAAPLVRAHTYDWSQVLLSLRLQVTKVGFLVHDTRLGLKVHSRPELSSRMLRRCRRTGACS
jgi:hypothetical protein